MDHAALCDLVTDFLIIWGSISFALTLSRIVWR